MSFINRFTSTKFPSSCNDFTGYKPIHDYKQIKSAEAALPGATPEQKGPLYADMALHFLKAAVQKSVDGDEAATKMYLDGSDYGRNTLDASGNRKGYDGVNDLLYLSAKNGANTELLHKMSECSKDLKSFDRSGG